MSRLFQPRLSNPLHASDAHQSTSLKPILKTPVTPQRGLHDPNPATSDEDPFPPDMSMILDQDTSIPAVQELDHMFSSDTATMQETTILPAFFHSVMDLPSATDNLEDITRMNLLHLMVHKGITLPPPLHAPHHSSQHIPSITYTNTMTQLFPRPRTSRTRHNREEDSENDPVTVITDDSSSYMTEDDSAPQSHKPSSYGHHRVRVLSQSLKTNTPLFPKPKPKPPLTKPRIFEWANGLNRLWYLLEQGKYSHKHHNELRSLLESIDQEKDRPGLGLMWLRDTKLIDILKKFKKDERMQDFDPWVRGTAGQIIRFWRGQFTT